MHCVIIGFAAFDTTQKYLFEYDDIRGEPHPVKVANINPYLVDAPDVILQRRSHPISNVPEIGIGNKPIDDGNYLFKPDEKVEFLRREPSAEKYFRRWIGADEFLNNTERWCLWVRDIAPHELKKMPEVLKRIDAVREFRLATKSEPTRKLAEMPARFHVEFLPSDATLVIPRHSSERRKFIPFGFFGEEALIGDACLCARDITSYHFGILSSTMHSAWVRYTCGRLESRYRYSKDIVYNNFPWPDKPSDKHVKAVEDAAKGVLAARLSFPASSLSDLYDPLTMPPALVHAHQVLDRAVDAAYGKKSFASDAERVAFLFELYQRYTSLLPATATKPTRKRAKASES